MNKKQETFSNFVNEQRKDAAEYLSGNKLIPGSETASHCYCGHQFGHFAGQLGDGAAMLVLLLF